MIKLLYHVTHISIIITNFNTINFCYNSLASNSSDLKKINCE